VVPGHSTVTWGSKYNGKTRKLKSKAIVEYLLRPPGAMQEEQGGGKE
jgi:hypothetical protein